MKETGLTGKRRSTTIGATPYDGKSQRERRRRDLVLMWFDRNVMYSVCIYDLSVHDLSHGWVSKKNWIGGWVGGLSSIQFFFGFLEKKINFAKSLTPKSFSFTVLLRIVPPIS